MTNIVEPHGTEIAAPTTAGTGSNVGSALRVRVCNSDASTAHLLTIQKADETVIGTMTLAPGEVVVVVKGATDELFAGNNAVKLVKCGYPRG